MSFIEVYIEITTSFRFFLSRASVSTSLDTFSVGFSHVAAQVILD